MPCSARSTRSTAIWRERPHPLLGRGSLHASLIAGGVELSSYPAQCTLSVERRTLPGETGADIEAELEALLSAAAPRTRSSSRPSARCSCAIRSRSTRTTRSCAAARSGRPRSPKIGGGSYWADSSFIAAAGIPTVLFGPSGEGAHAVEEWVSLSATETVTQTLIGLARRVCA